MKISFCSFFIALLFIVHCSAQQKQATSTFAANWNDHIDAKSRGEIKLLNDKLIASFIDENTQQLVSLYSDRLKKKVNGRSEGLIKSVHPDLTSRNYTLFDEYLCKNSAIGTDATIFKSVNEDNDYKVNYTVYTPETYISLLVCKGDHGDWLVTAMYGKYAGEWKLDVILIGQFKILNKNYVDLYKQAKKDYANGNLIGTINYMFVSKMVSAPSGDYFIYFKTPEIENFRNKIGQELNSTYKFPIIIPDIKTTPRIHGVEPIITNEGVFSSVNYISSIPLKDTVALRVENDQIKKVIGKIFPGIEKNRKYVLFKAYNQIGDKNTLVEHHGFILKTGEK